MPDLPTPGELADQLNETQQRVTALRRQLDDMAVTRLTDSLLDGFALFDPAGVVVSANPALCALTGFDEQEIVGTGPPHPYWPPEQEAAFSAALAETLSGQVHPHELWLLRKDGERIPVVITPSVLRNDDGSVVSVSLLFRDLSERRRFEAALTESEGLFRLTFDQAPHGAVLAGPDFGFRRVNDAFCEMLGYGREELLALRFPDITHPDDVELDVQEVARLGRGEIREYARDKRYLRKDGGVRWGHVMVRPVISSAGERIAYLAMIDDITERQQALEELRLSEQRLRTVLDAAHEGIILQARDGTVLTFNKAAGEVFGVTEADVVGRSALGRDWETIYEDGTPWPPQEHPTMLAMRSGKPVMDLVLGVVREGETRWLTASAHPIVPEGETEAVAAVVSFADETDRLQAERALRESEERYRLLLQNQNDAVYVHEATRESPGRMLDVNARACEMLGYTRDEFLSMDVPAIDVPEQARRLPEIMRRLHETGAAVFTTEHVAKDGRRVPVEVSTRLFDINGRPTVLSVVRDITERRTAEHAVAEAQRLLNETQEISKLGGWEYDVAADHFTWTDEVYRIYGVEHDFDVDHVDRNISFYSPEDQAVIAEAWSGVVESGTPYDLELRFTSADGKRLWVRTLARADVEDGRVVRVLGNIIDITERKQTEEALAAARERAQTYLDLAGVMIVAVRSDGAVSLANRKACEILGRAEPEVVGRDWFDLAVPDEAGPAVREVFDGLMRGAGEAREFFENDIVTATGERRLIAWHNVMLRDADGAVTGTLSSGEDITEQRATETALRESETKYREVVERASDGIVLVRPDGILFANAAFCEMTGYARDELLRLPVVELVCPDQREAMADRARRRLAGEAVPSSYEVDLLRKDGSLVGVDLSAGVVEIGGKPTDLIVARDITERRQAERALRDSQAVRERAEAIAHVGSWSWDPAARLATWSPEMYRLFDVDPGDFDGDFTPILESRVHPGDRDGLRAAIEAAATGNPMPVEYRVIHRDGSEHILRGEGSAERDTSGTLSTISGYYQDITERRRSEQTMREAEKRYRSLFEQSPISLWEEDFSAVRDWLDAQGDVDDWPAYFDQHPEHAVTCAGLVRILACNQSSLRLFGVSSREDLIRELPRYFTEESYAPFRDEIVTLAHGGTSFATEVSMVNRDGVRRVLDLRLNVIPGHEERLDRALVSFVDVTEQQAAEAEIRRLNEELQRRVVSRTEQLEAATRELEALAYSIAHDVRAPLRTIDGFSAAVMEDEAARLSDEGVTALRRVRGAAQTLARLLDDLMGLSHVSRRDLVRQPVDLSSLAREIGEECAGDHPSRQVELTVAPGLTADADPNLVRLIFRELLGNAWKFTAPNPTARVEVGALDTGGERAFFVRDDGVGFDMRYAEHLFGIFQRMHPPGQFEGDGVGLATVQRLVRRHGGRAWAESQPGRGTMVCFTLPDEAEQ